MLLENFRLSKEKEIKKFHDDYTGQMKIPNPKTLINLVQRKVGVEVSYSTTLRWKYEAVWVLAYTCSSISIPHKERNAHKEHKDHNE